MSSDSAPTISAIIPVYNGGENFRECLFALSATRPPPDELIVVADGVTDGSAEHAEALGAHVVRTPVRSGPAVARNLGAYQATGDILFFLDADVVVYPDTIDQVATLFRDNPSVAAAFGSYDDAPAGANFLSQYKNLFHHYIHQTAAEEASTFWSGCGAIRRSVFLELGGFDVAYGRPVIEDIELGYRLRRAGYRIRLSKTLQVKHLKRWGFLSLIKADFFYRALPWTELILRYNDLVNDLNLRTSSRISTAMAYWLLLALLGALWWPGALLLAGVVVVGLVALNAPLYRFFWHKRGGWFTLRAVAWHWFYYLYSGLAFAVGLLRHLVAGRTGAAHA